MMGMAVIMEEEQDEHVLADMLVLQKQGNVCRAVLNKVSTNGMTATETRSCFEQQLHYLSMDPEAPIPFPNHFMKSMSQQIIEDAWPAEKFWDMLVRERIITFCITDVGVDEFQMDTFSAKIMLLAQDKSDDDCIAALYLLCIRFPIKNSAPWPLPLACARRCPSCGS